MPQGFLSLHLDSGLALCAYTRAHTHSSFYGKFYCPCVSLSFPLLSLLPKCDLCFLAFQEFLRISSSILACLVSIPPSLYNVLVMIFQPPPQPWLWAGSGEASTAHWCHRVCPGSHSQEMVPVCFLSLCSFSYITPRPQRRMAFPFITVDIWDWNSGGRASNIYLSLNENQWK